jgi:hypothetical protein
MMPTSASSLSSRCSQRSGPGPSEVGAARRLVDGRREARVAAAAARAADRQHALAGAVRSPMSSPLSRSVATVPSGTRSTRSLPPAPEQLLPWPCCPRSAW